MTRSIVKTNYIKLGDPEGSGARGRVKASARYYGHRPNEEGRREWRDAFSGDRDRMTKEEAYEQVLNAEGEYAYRIVLSPGREMDEGELVEWARDVMALGDERGWFEGDRELGGWASGEDAGDTAERWVAWAHTDHTDNPHVHVIAFTDRLFDVDDFEKVRQEGDLSVEQAMDWRVEVEQDPMREEELGREPAQRGQGWGGVGAWRLDLGMRDLGRSSGGVEGDGPRLSSGWGLGSPEPVSDEELYQDLIEGFYDDRFFWETYYSELLNNDALVPIEGDYRNDVEDRYRAAVSEREGVAEEKEREEDRRREEEKEREQEPEW